MQKHRILVRAILVLAMGVAATITTPSSATASAPSASYCETCIDDMLCQIGGGQIMCIFLCPGATGGSMCGGSCSEGAAGQVKLYCDSEY